MFKNSLDTEITKLENVWRDKKLHNLYPFFDFAFKIYGQKISIAKSIVLIVAQTLLLYHTYFKGLIAKLLCETVFSLNFLFTRVCVQYKICNFICFLFKVLSVKPNHKFIFQLLNSNHFKHPAFIFTIFSHFWTISVTEECIWLLRGVWNLLTFQCLALCCKQHYMLYQQCHKSKG